MRDRPYRQNQPSRATFTPMTFLALTDYALRRGLTFEQIALRRVVLFRQGRHCGLRSVFCLTAKGVWESTP